jgi:thiamine-monophosphate kinase
MSAEDELTRRFAELFASSGRVDAREGDAVVTLGVGDDSALVSLRGQLGSSQLALSVDTQVENVHFRRAWLTVEEIGYRATMAAASDLAAMGALPLWALSALIVPRHFADQEVLHLAQGQAEAARELGMTIVGGNLSSGSELSVTTTVIGKASRVYARTGAKSGEGVYLCGGLGRAAMGLSWLLAEQDPNAACTRWFRRPKAHVAVALGESSAAMDLSDGLVVDGSRFARASGVTINFEASALRAAAGDEVFAMAHALGEEAMQWILYGGEDYALLATSAHPLPGFARIGTTMPFIANAPILLDGEPVIVRGFDHRTT